MLGLLSSSAISSPKGRRTWSALSHSELVILTLDKRAQAVQTAQNTAILRKAEDLMEKALGVTEARMRLSTIVERVQRQGDTHHISWHGQLAAALLHLEVYANWQRQRQELFDLVGKLHNEPDLLPKEADRVTGEAVAAIPAVG
jgi:hypothetical protein